MTENEKKAITFILNTISLDSLTFDYLMQDGQSDVNYHTVIDAFIDDQPILLHFDIDGAGNLAGWELLTIKKLKKGIQKFFDKSATIKNIDDFNDHGTKFDADEILQLSTFRKVMYTYAYAD